jgi:hypothetical protein
LETGSETAASEKATLIQKIEELEKQVETKTVTKKELQLRVTDSDK